MDAIVVEDLRKQYKAVHALDGISFSVREGEVFGLLGPNGAGKSTTVRVLTTLTRPDSGRALVAGHDVCAHPNRVRRAIGYVAQDSGVDWEATGRENLLLQGRIHGMAGAPLRARVGELLELVGLADSADRVRADYSGGMKRRLDIAIGLVHKPQRAVPRRADHGARPRGARGDVGRGRAARARRSASRSCSRRTTSRRPTGSRSGSRSSAAGAIVVEGRPDELKAGLAGRARDRRAPGDGRARHRRGRGGARSRRRARSPSRGPVRAGARAERRTCDPGHPRRRSTTAAIPVASVTTSRPSLDDVYLHYTGRDFAKEDEEGTR